MMVRNIRVGIPMVGGHGWLGGVSYIEVLVKAVTALPRDERPSLHLVVHEANLADLDLYQPFLSCFDGVLFIGSDPTPLAGRVSRLEATVSSWDEVYRRVDLLFPLVSNVHAGYPGISWIPDFQHVHLPQFFSGEELLQRDHAFRLISEHADVVLLSSRDALQDYRKRFPQSHATLRVLNFFNLPQPAWFEQDAGAIQRKYGLPDEFLITCNQFWAHKNHRTLFEAIALLGERGLALSLVCTGAIEDYRNRGYFAELKDYATSLGIDDRLFILGSLPRMDQIQLIRRAMALVQPSLFEGWSTVIEDGRALGKRMFLSDLDVHREQDPFAARYFARMSASDLADLIMEAHPSLAAGPDLPAEQAALTRAEVFATRYARTFVAIVRDAWIRFHDRSLLRSETPHARLPDSRAFNILLLDQQPNAMEHGLRAYLEAFSSEADVALHILAGNDLEQCQARVLGVIADCGMDPEAIADVSIVDLVPTPATVTECWSAVDLVMGASQAQASLPPLLAQPTSARLRQAHEAFLAAHTRLLEEGAPA